MARRNDQERPHKLPPGWRLPEEQPEEAPEKPVEEMSDEELEAAIAQTKRDLLAAARAESEKARKEPQLEGERRYWEFKRRPYWRGG
jgi:hypothetical protein